MTDPKAQGRLRIGMVAGEPSGDLLGAELIEALQALHPGIEFVGAGGPRMRAAGLTAVVAMEDLSMHGFAEPIRRFGDLLGMLLRLRTAVRAARVDVFVGIDFNVFNLLLERLLKRSGIRTVHYVSPSVYAWRRGRVRRIGRCADRVLTLFPFEPALYRGHGVDAVCVGHPLVDRLDPATQRTPARAHLGIAEGEVMVAVLPGSRRSEIRQLADVFLATVAWLHERRPGWRFMVPCVDPSIRATLAAHPGTRNLPVTLLEGQSGRVLAACDVALLKSGTATLEAMLLERPMVVGYRLGAVTHAIVRRLLQTRWVALPNILAGRELVPELLQDAASAPALGQAVLDQLERMQRDPGLLEAYRAQREALGGGAAARAAQAVMEVADRGPAR